LLLWHSIIGFEQLVAIVIPWQFWHIIVASFIYFEILISTNKIFKNYVFSFTQFCYLISWGNFNILKININNVEITNVIGYAPSSIVLINLTK
jgi:hypothetical protein